MRRMKFGLIGLTVALLLIGAAFGVSGQCDNDGADVTCDADDGSANLNTEIGEASVTSEDNTGTIEEEVTISDDGPDVYTGDGNDTVNVEAGATVDAGLEGGNGDDTFNIEGNVEDIDGDDDDDTVNVSGNGSVDDVDLGNDADTFTASGNAVVNEVRGRDGDDTFNVSGNATVTDRIGGGDGEDTFNLSGSASVGSVHGGPDSDTFNVEDSVSVDGALYGSGPNYDEGEDDTLNIGGGGCSTTEGGANDANEAIESQGGQGRYRGLTWTQFENVNGNISAEDCSGNVQFDGRFNIKVSVLAPVAMYCGNNGLQNTVELYAVSAAGEGSFGASVTRGEIALALANAASSGVSQILAEVNGTTFRAEPDGTLSVTGSYLNGDGLYVETFDGSQCG